MRKGIEMGTKYVRQGMMYLLTINFLFTNSKDSKTKQTTRFYVCMASLISCCHHHLTLMNLLMTENVFRSKRKPHLIDSTSAWCVCSINHRIEIDAYKMHRNDKNNHSCTVGVSSCMDNMGYLGIWKTIKQTNSIKIHKLWLGMLDKAKPLNQTRNLVGYPEQWKSIMSVMSDTPYRIVIL